MSTVYSYQRKSKPTERTCKLCGKTWTRPDSYRVSYCSAPCRSAAAKAKQQEMNPRLNLISTGTVGAMHELVVCVDLLRRGYEIFRAVSPSCSCDLVALCNGKSVRIEVRTGYANKSGGFTWTNQGRDVHKYDVVAVVLHAGGIKYLPEGVL